MNLRRWRLDVDVISDGPYAAVQELLGILLTEDAQALEDEGWLTSEDYEDYDPAAEVPDHMEAGELVARAGE